MKGIENKKSSLQLEKIIVEDLSFKRINNEKSKIDNNSEIIKLQLLFLSILMMYVI